MLYLWFIKDIIMEILQSYHNNLLRQVSLDYVRPFYSNIHWDQRMLAIKGSRGSGKTTLMLQHLLKNHGPHAEQALYVSADFHWFYRNTLFDTTDQFYKNGGRFLYIDEVHKYPRWSRELKNIYDGFPDLQVIFSSSSALEIYRGESDLSRRVMTYLLPGLSFREYLWLMLGAQFPKISLEDILTKHAEYSSEIVKRLHPLPLFRKYLETGYLPIIKAVPEEEVHPRLTQIINTVLENDLVFIENYNAATAFKVKKLLGLLADSSPFKPNIAALSRKLDVSRDSVYAWFQHLERAKLLNLLRHAGKGSSLLQKPDKVYLENTNLAYALKPSADRGSVRETFMLNQLINAGHKVSLAPKGDFLVNDRITLEVGGKSKTGSQIKGLEHAYIVKDDIEYGFAASIPLWLFGFLY